MGLLTRPRLKSKNVSKLALFVSFGVAKLISLLDNFHDRPAYKKSPSFTEARGICVQMAII